mmetsp:Transcript_55586/g.176495  ORF Transcript_55586/g.176495 Transcript_55586/m.176495 type:complete len:228 (-) Transcript_55586:768-1451(-)
MELSSRERRRTRSGTPASSLLRASTTWPQSTEGVPSSPVWWKRKSRNSLTRYRSPVSAHPWCMSASGRSATALILTSKRRSRPFSISLLSSEVSTSEKSDACSSSVNIRSPRSPHSWCTSLIPPGSPAETRPATRRASPVEKCAARKSMEAPKEPHASVRRRPPREERSSRWSSRRSSLGSPKSTSTSPHADRRSLPRPVRSTLEGARPPGRAARPEEWMARSALAI